MRAFIQRKKLVENTEKKPRVAFFTLGCKLNFAETATITRLFLEKGYQKTAFNADADVYVINTCSVTAQADKKCRQAITKATRNGGKVVVIGCYSQLKPDEIAALQGVDLVLGTRDKFNIIERLADLERGVSQRVHSSCIDAVEDFNASFSLSDRTRAFLKVQDGCDYSCTYCTIPLARGKSRNPNIDNIIANAKEIAATGIREVVLTGVNIGDFGKTTGDHFFDLVKALDKVDGILRYRISSIEPNLITPEIIEYISNSPKFAHHFHIPLQSGNNKVLGLMSRRYKRELYADRVAEIRKKISSACIGADVIVGFPGETEADFEDTFAFIRDLGLSYLHVFPYSERPDTKAIHLEGKVSAQDKEIRVKRLIELSERLRLNFYTQHIGTEQEVLFENSFVNNKASGFTNNYIRIEVDSETSLRGKLAKVKLEKTNENGHVNSSFLTK